MPIFTQINQAKLLLGEGREEVIFFTQVLSARGLQGIQVESYGGKSRLPDFLRTLSAFPGFSLLQSVAITRDADDNAAGAFQSVRASLENANLPAPHAPGTFAPLGHPRVGVLIIPPEQPHGMLEDLCLMSVRQDPAIRCMDEFFACVTSHTGRTPSNMAKARVHAWLSTQQQPDKQLGTAALAGYWPLGDSAFNSLNHFLQQL